MPASFSGVCPCVFCGSLYPHGWMSIAVQLWHWTSSSCDTEHHPVVTLNIIQFWHWTSSSCDTEHHPVVTLNIIHLWHWTSSSCDIEHHPVVTLNIIQLWHWTSSSCDTEHHLVVTLNIIQLSYRTSHGQHSVQCTTLRSVDSLSPGDEPTKVRRMSGLIWTVCISVTWKSTMCTYILRTWRSHDRASW